MTPEGVIAALEKGRQYLADHEWTRGHYYGVRVDEYGIEHDDPSVCCGLGAVKAANGWDDVFVPEHWQVAWALDAVVPCKSFTMFNDTMAGSRDEVLEVFDRAIAKLREPDGTHEGDTR